mmetsp:Transcript_15351/g.14948  ORF Transcript_15351/g.14948 Transcript_15351/m.14948 type:complete len:526 (-) Transcript_15351:178-1755(-)
MLHRGVIKLPKQRPVHVVLPLLFGVLAILGGGHAGDLDEGVVGVHQVQIPHSSHEQLEVVVVVADLGADEHVVLEELLEGDGLVGLEGLGHIVVGGEQVIELIPALFNGFEAALDVGVPGGVELLFDLVDLQRAVAVGVELLEGLAHQTHPHLAQLPQQRPHELLKVDRPIPILIKDGEEDLGFLLGDAHLVVVQSLFELIHVQGATPVTVHDLELPLQPNEPLRASPHDLLLELLDGDFILFLAGHGAEGLVVLIGLLGGPHMVAVLVPDVAHKRIVLALHACDLVELAAILLLVEARVGEGLALLGAAVLGLAQREVGGVHAALEGRVPIRVIVLASIGRGPRSGPWTPFVLVGPALVILLVGRGVPRDVPGGIHHRRKVHVIVDGGGDVGVVLHELLHGHAAVRLRPMHQVVVRLERLQELPQHLLLRLPPFRHCRMLLSVINVLDVVDVDDAAPVLVELLEGCLHQPHPALVQIPLDHSQKLIVLDGAVFVHVEALEDQGDVILGHLTFEVSTSLLELWLR